MFGESLAVFSVENHSERFYWNWWNYTQQGSFRASVEFLHVLHSFEKSFSISVGSWNWIMWLSRERKNNEIYKIVYRNSCNKRAYFNKGQIWPPLAVVLFFIGWGGGMGNPSEIRCGHLTTLVVPKLFAVGGKGNTLSCWMLRIVRGVGADETKTAKTKFPWKKENLEISVLKVFSIHVRAEVFIYEIPWNCRSGIKLY